MRARAVHIQEDLSRLGLLPTAESDQVGALLSRARTLEIALAEEGENATVLRETLLSLERGLTKVSRDHQRHEDTLRCCEASEGEDSQVVEKAIIDCEVCPSFYAPKLCRRIEVTIDHQKIDPAQLYSLFERFQFYNHMVWFPTWLLTRAQCFSVR